MPDQTDQFPAGLRRRLVWRIAIPLVGAVGRVAWNLRIEIDEPLPSGPFVLAANHHSFLDPPLIAAAIGRPVRFLALSDLFGRSRILDFTLDSFEAIPLPRGRLPLSAMRAALAQLARGGVVGVFPEGTRSSTWGSIPARRGASWLAEKMQVPLVPAAIAGSDVVLGVDNKLRPGRIRVHLGPPLVPAGQGRAAVTDLASRWTAWVTRALDHTAGRG